MARDSPLEHTENRVAPALNVNVCCAAGFCVVVVSVSQTWHICILWRFSLPFGQTSLGDAVRQVHNTRKRIVNIRVSGAPQVDVIIYTGTDYGDRHGDQLCTIWGALLLSFRNGHTFARGGRSSRT